MREVAVHLEHELGAVRERTAEAGEVRGPETFLALAMDNENSFGLRAGQFVGERAGAVR